MYIYIYINRERVRVVVLDGVDFEQGNININSIYSKQSI